MEYLLYIVIWIMGAVYGWYARERHAQRTLKSLLSQVEETVKTAVDDSIIPIVIEKNNGVFYVWGKDTNDFMAQGMTRKELEDNLAKRYPEKRFAATTENLKVFR
jgi:hypothetical protein